MKLTVAALALLVAGAAYADVATASITWTPLKEAVTPMIDGSWDCSNSEKHGGSTMKCTASGFGTTAGGTKNNVKVKYTAKLHGDAPKDVKEHLHVHGKKVDVIADVEQSDKFGGSIKFDGPKGQIKGAIKDKMNYPANPPARMQPIHETRHYKCETYNHRMGTVEAMGVRCDWDKKDF